MIILVVVLLNIGVSEATYCPSWIKIDQAVGKCNISTADGFEMTDYYCSDICCGGKIVAKGKGVECCGNEAVGEIYNQKKEICCQWWYTGEFAVHKNQNKGDHCCGTSLFTYDTYSDGTNCCRGWKTTPKPFQSKKEMCCKGQTTLIGDTGHGACCGVIGYDRRTHSCPCKDKPVSLFNQAVECCRSSTDYSVVSSFDSYFEGCCDGLAYNLKQQFCCNGLVGNISTHTCCNHILVPRNQDSLGQQLGCCELLDGSQFQYNFLTEACCEGIITTVPFGTKGICCGDQLSFVSSRGQFGCCTSYEDHSTVYDQSMEVCCNGTVDVGNDCCGEVAYDTNQHVCCDELIGEGDDCCGKINYFKSEHEICCSGELGGSTFKIPSCCSNQTFDAYTHTCCGEKLYDNPQIEGEPEVSRSTRCCGSEEEVPESFLPYDYYHSICCDGVIIDVGLHRRGTLKCCGSKVYRSGLQRCCNGTVALANMPCDVTGSE